MKNRNAPALRWGILGTGQIAKKFATDLPFSHTGTLVAAASRSEDSAKAFANDYGGIGMSGYETLLANPDVEAVYISLPNALHKEWSIKAMLAGKHVLCEKPIALNATEAEEMFAVAEKTDRILIEAFMYRAQRQTHQLFQAIKDGIIGELRIIRANFTFSRKPSESDARFQPGAGGGSIMDVGSYCTDFIRMLAGAEPSQIHSIIHQHKYGGVDDYAAGSLGFENGLLATFTCGMTVESDQTAHIAGTTGRIEITRFWRAQEGYTIFRPGETPEKPIPEFISLRDPETRPIYAVEADAFADVVSEKIPNWNPPGNTINNMLVLDELRKLKG